MDWGGLVLLVALMLAALLASGVLASFASGVECSVTRIMGGVQSCASQPGQPDSDPDAPWSSANPVTRVTWGTYVSLGDSYSAGEGLGNYEPGSHVDQSQCRVSVLDHPTAQGQAILGQLINQEISNPPPGGS